MNFLAELKHVGPILVVVSSELHFTKVYVRSILAMKSYTYLTAHLPKNLYLTALKLAISSYFYDVVPCWKEIEIDYLKSCSSVFSYLLKISTAYPLKTSVKYGKADLRDKVFLSMGKDFKYFLNIYNRFVCINEQHTGSFFSTTPVFVDVDMNSKMVNDWFGQEVEFKSINIESKISRFWDLLVNKESAKRPCNLENEGKETDAKDNCYASIKTCNKAIKYIEELVHTEIEYFEMLDGFYRSIVANEEAGYIKCIGRFEEFIDIYKAARNFAAELLLHFCCFANGIQNDSLEPHNLLKACNKNSCMLKKLLSESEFQIEVNLHTDMKTEFDLSNKRRNVKTTDLFDLEHKSDESRYGIINMLYKSFIEVFNLNIPKLFVYEKLFLGHTELALMIEKFDTGLGKKATEVFSICMQRLFKYPQIVLNMSSTADGKHRDELNAIFNKLTQLITMFNLRTEERDRIEVMNHLMNTNGFRQAMEDKRINVNDVNTLYGHQSDKCSLNSHNNCRECRKLKINSRFFIEQLDCYDSSNMQLTLFLFSDLLIISQRYQAPKLLMDHKEGKFCLQYLLFLNDFEIIQTNSKTFYLFITKNHPRLKISCTHDHGDIHTEVVRFKAYTFGVIDNFISQYYRLIATSKYSRYLKESLLYFSLNSHDYITTSEPSTAGRLCLTMKKEEEIAEECKKDNLLFSFKVDKFGIKGEVYYAEEDNACYSTLRYNVASFDDFIQAFMPKMNLLKMQYNGNSVIELLKFRYYLEDLLEENSGRSFIDLNLSSVDLLTNHQISVRILEMINYVVSNRLKNKDSCSEMFLTTSIFEKNNGKLREEIHLWGQKTKEPEVLTGMPEEGMYEKGIVDKSLQCCENINCPIAKLRNAMHPRSTLSSDSSCTYREPNVVVSCSRSKESVATKLKFYGDLSRINYRYKKAAVSQTYRSLILNEKTLKQSKDEVLGALLYGIRTNLYALITYEEIENLYKRLITNGVRNVVEICKHFPGKSFINDFMRLLLFMRDSCPAELVSLLGYIFIGYDFDTDDLVDVVIGIN